MPSTAATVPAPAVADATAASPGVRAPIRMALSLSFLNTIITRIGTFLMGIVLARLLTPHDFGVYAAALVVLNLLLSMNELGVSLAIVRWPGNPREIAPTVNTIAASASLLLYVGCWFGAPAVAHALGAPAATGVIRLLSVGVVIDGLTSTSAQLLNREFKQGRRLIVDSGNLVVTTGVTVALAATGHGAWSLAVGTLVGNALGAVGLFQMARAWPRPGFNRAQAGELLKFGLPLAAASLLMIGMLNIQYVITGSFLGAAALGMYLLAFNLSSWPVNVFSQIARRVSLAAFSRVQDDAALRQETMTRMAVLLAVTTLPVCALLGLLALPAITTVYGHIWRPAAQALPFLAIFAAVRVAAELSYDFLVALGRSRTTLWLQGVWLAALAVALPIGASWDGIRGVALAHAGVALLFMLPAYGFAVARTGISMRPLLHKLARPVLGSGLLALGVLGVRAVTHPGAVQLVAGAVLGVVLYVPIVWPLRHTIRHLDH